MISDASQITDTVFHAAGYSRAVPSRLGLAGLMTVELFDRFGELKQAEVVKNLITQVGDQAYAERGAGIMTLGAPTGIRLGTGTTATAKTGAGAAMVTYVAGSSIAFDATYPQSALNGSARRITYRCTWAAGVATAMGIAEAVITNIAIADVAGAAANTVARALLSSAVNKEASDSLVVTWTHDAEGA